MPREIQTFGDGIVKICSVENVAERGNAPKDKLSEAYTLRYKERTVGVTRYWTAMQNNIKVDTVIRCHRVRDVTTGHVAVLQEGKQYAIKQIQYPEGILPPVMDLSLERIEKRYEFVGD